MPKKEDLRSGMWLPKTTMQSQGSESPARAKTATTAKCQGSRESAESTAGKVLPQYGALPQILSMCGKKLLKPRLLVESPSKWQAGRYTSA